MLLFPLTKRDICPRNGKSWRGASAQESLVLCRAHRQYTPQEKNLSLPRVGQAKWKNPEHHTDAQGQPGLRKELFLPRMTGREEA